jgi:hypothetical protein
MSPRALAYALAALVAAGCTTGPLALDGGVPDGAALPDGAAADLALPACLDDGGTSLQPIDVVALLARADCARDVRCGLVAADRLDECAAHPYPFQISSTRVHDPLLLDPARVAVDCAALADCQAGLTVSGCVGRASEVPACERVLVGLVAPGGACTDDLHCAGGGFCDQRAAGCEGTCRAGLPAGAFCGVALCAPGLVCATVCTAPGGDGAPCRPAGNDELCQPGLFCQGSACAPALPVGAPCVLGQTCSDGAYCEGIECSTGQGQCAGLTGACTAIEPDGTACIDDLQCASGHCIGQFKDQQQGGTCGPPSAIGGPCTPQRVDCQLTLYCDATSRTCAPWIDPGAACAQSGWWCAAGSTCAGAACAPMGTDGDACDATHPCDDWAGYKCDPASARCALYCPPILDSDGGCGPGGCA